MFHKFVENKNFYNIAKKSSKNGKDDTLIAMNKFFKACEKSAVLPQPNFINFTDNTLYFVE
jgi:hypothetical protein